MTTPQNPDNDSNNISQHNYHLYLPPGANSKKESDDIEAMKSLFKIALQTRNFEISQLVQRNNFFMIFQGVLFAGLIQSSHTKPIVSFMVCLIGLVIAIFQVGTASGAKFWQEYWELVLSKIEFFLIKNISHNKKSRRLIIQLFHDNSARYQEMVKESLGSKSHSFTSKLILCRFSVSRIPIYVGLAFALTWLLLLLSTMRAYPPLSVPSCIVGF